MSKKKQHAVSTTQLAETHRSLEGSVISKQIFFVLFYFLATYSVLVTPLPIKLRVGQERLSKSGQSPKVESERRYGSTRVPGHAFLA
jgi:hypothetical protein